MNGKFLFVHVNEWATFDSPDSIPISQGYIAAYLKQQGFECRILGDYKEKPLSSETFKKALQDLQPSIIGFSVYEENINRIRVLARFAKNVLPKVKIILGGPQTTFMPQEGLRQMSEIDILCRGEGETVSLELARTMANGGELRKVPGICFKQGEQVIETEPAELVENLDDFPSPYLENIINPQEKYRAMLFSSRGCSSPCTFCYTTRASRGRVRFHSIERIINEMLHLNKIGITDFWFADPNFAFSRDRLMSLLLEIIYKVPGITFWCQTRYNLIDDELLALLMKAGCHTIAFGLESAAKDVLVRIKKGLSPDRMSRVIRKVQDAGIDVELFTLFGLPGETPEQAEATLDFVKANNVPVAGNSISQQLHLFHGTPISVAPLTHGVVPQTLTKPAYLSVCRDFTTDSMSREDIDRMSLLWRLNRSDFSENLDSANNLFEVAAFIIHNRNTLSSRPEAGIMLTRIYLALEEYEAAGHCLKQLQKDFPEDSQVKQFLEQQFTGFKLKRRIEAQPGSKVIYDCKGTVDGKQVYETEGYFQNAVLGSSGLLPDFEKAFNGLRSGRCTQCQVEFPQDYGNQELAGKVAVFQIYLQQVMAPLSYSATDILSGKVPKNRYRFTDLDSLKKQNETLYYLALKDHSINGLTQDMTHYLSLLHFYFCLGFEERSRAMIELLPPDKSLHLQAGRLALSAGQYALALELIESIPEKTEEREIYRTKILIKLTRYQEAEEALKEKAYQGNVQCLDLRVGLASLLHKPVEEYLARMDALIDYQVRAMG